MSEKKIYMPGGEAEPGLLHCAMKPELMAQDYCSRGGISAFMMDVMRDTPIEALRCALSGRQGIPYELVHLISGGRILHDDRLGKRTRCDYELQNQSSVNMLGRLGGSGSYFRNDQTGAAMCCVGLQVFWSQHVNMLSSISLRRWHPWHREGSCKDMSDSQASHAYVCRIDGSVCVVAADAVTP